MIDLIDSLHEHGMAALAVMTPAQRAALARARQAMFDFFDHMWDELKHHGLRPADHPEQYNAVAAMRDLTNHLYFGSVKETHHAAGDEDDE